MAKSIVPLVLLLLLASQQAANAQWNRARSVRTQHAHPPCESVTWSPCWEPKLDWSTTHIPASQLTGVIANATPVQHDLFTANQPLGSSQVVSASLAAGQRPIVILVPLAPRELVARSVVTWGYSKSDGTSARGGLSVFDYQGGVVVGVIAEDVAPASIEIHARVDYVQPEIVDLDYVLSPTVGTSGVNAVVHTTANLIQQRLILRSLKEVRSSDYLDLRFTTPPMSSSTGANSSSVGSASQPEPIRQSGSTTILAEQLKGAVGAITEVRVAIPTPVVSGQKIQWLVRGRIGGKQVEKQFDVLDQEAIEIFLNEKGVLDVWARNE